ncbi:MAG: (deoxy)nucleoside triphosphate pyrophosphohydrolase [Pseudomonadota bacterium]
MEPRRKIRVVGALIEKDGKFLATQRAGTGPFAGKWEFAGGKVREGEGDQEALRREIREELGIDITVGELESETEHDYPTLSIRLCLYHCSWIRGAITRSNEHKALAWVARDEFDRYDFLEADRPVLTRLARRS